MIDQLKEQIKVVAWAREKTKVAKDVVALSQAAWAEEHKEVIALAHEYAEEMGVEETALRDLTIEIFNTTGNKAPAKGVGIREGVRLEYEPVDAIRWAKEHRIALQLDTKEFERIAKELSDPLPFVTKVPTVTATIAQVLTIEEAIDGDS